MENHLDFVHLHVHTEYSLLDGAIRINDMIDRALSLGMDSVAITDHGNMYGVVQFFDRARKKGIKPIIGCEVYVAKGSRFEKSATKNSRPVNNHLVLLVMNSQGYKNLTKLVTAGFLEGHYYEPRIDMDILREMNKGLIALSACKKGIIPSLILEDRIDEAKEKAEEFLSIFGDSRFYLEVQANGLPEQNKINQGIKEFAHELSIPMVATNDCHYLNKEDSEIQDILLCIQTNKTINEKDRLRFQTNELYFKSREEMELLLNKREFGEALDNTVLIAGMCNFEMNFGKYKYPKFDLPNGKSLEDLLKEKAYEGFKRRLYEKETSEGALTKEQLEEYKERLEFELKVITEMGFSGYFLIVADFIEYARRSGIPVGPGRGSAAGSLVAYCLRITNIDPIKYGLIFERFLNPERISMPDIDIDFCMTRRDEIIDYVAQKYGRDRVSQIITFGTMKARGVIRDVGRSLDISYGEVDAIAKLVPEGPNVKLKDAIKEEPELKKLEHMEGPKGDLLRISKALEGLRRHPSIHASGVVIADKPLVEYLPLCIEKNHNKIITQYTMEEIEKLGLIKFDFLGLKTLTVIRHALELIELTTGEKINIDNIPLDDKETYKLLSEGKTTGVFQLESSGMKELLRRLKPEKFDDLIALVALYRPGPLGSNMVDEFIKGKHEEKKIEYILPELEPILKETYGVILYQEQVMKIAQALSGYTMGEADELRKAIAKKKTQLIKKHRERFIEGGISRGFKREIVERLFSLIEHFGGYGFNKSHSAAYAMIAYQTAYLKSHYPLQFMASLLSQDMGNQDKTIKNIEECKKMGIKILPTDINESQADFAIVGDGIRFGLGAVKNVGLKAIEEIIQEREKNGPFKDIVDFCSRMDSPKVNRRVLESLIECGAFDFTGVFRSRMHKALDSIMKICSSCHRNPDQLNMFMGPSMTANTEIVEFPDIEEWDKKDKLKKEKEAIGFYITGHPLDGYDNDLMHMGVTSIDTLIELKDRSEIKIAGVISDVEIKRTKDLKKMAIIKFEDKTGAVDVLVFPDTFEKYKHTLTKEDEPLIISGIADVTENSVKIISNEISTIDTFRERHAKAIELEFMEEELEDGLIENLKDIILEHPGECTIYFKVNINEKDTYLIWPDDKFRVFPEKRFMQKVKELIKKDPILFFKGMNYNGIYL